MAHDDCAFNNLEDLAKALDRAGFTYVDTTWGNDEVPSITVTFNAPNYAPKGDYVDYQIFVPDCYDYNTYMVVDVHGSQLFDNANLSKLIRFLEDEEENYMEMYR